MLSKMRPLPCCCREIRSRWQLCQVTQAGSIGEAGVFRAVNENASDQRHREAGGDHPPTDPTRHKRIGRTTGGKT